jgi:hypothetical protein
MTCCIPGGPAFRDETFGNLWLSRTDEHRDGPAELLPFHLSCHPLNGGVTHGERRGGAHSASTTSVDVIPVNPYL